MLKPMRDTDTMIHLIFSDVRFGCDRFGWLHREDSDGDAEDIAEREDVAYQDHVRDTTEHGRATVVDGVLYLKK